MTQNKDVIFLCFSSKDRNTVVKSVRYHLKNYGLSIWYDYHKLFLGDNRNYHNFYEGILLNKYAIVIISENFFDCICANEELEIIKHQHEIGKMHIFPILYNITASELPDRYQWLRNLIYNEVTNKTGTLLTCNQIVCKFLSDKNNSLSLRQYQTFSIDGFVKELLSVYFDISEENINARILTLFTIYKYLIYTNPTMDYPQYCVRAFNRIYSSTKLNLKNDWKELSILENSLLLMISI